MRLKKYTLEQLKEAVASSISINQALSKLGLKGVGTNYYTFRKAVAFFNVDTSHFKGQAHSKGKKLGHRKQLSDYLSNKYPLSSHRLKKRLLAAGLFEQKCSCCSLTMWQGQPIPLELDHIDGNHYNNNLSNLRILCPNCHYQTHTNGGKNSGKYS